MSASRQNFATILVRTFLNREVRIVWNVHSKCGKQKLSVDIMADYSIFNNVILQVFAIELVTFAVDFVPLAV